MQPLKTYIKPLVLLLAVLAVLGLDRHYGWSEYLSSTDNLQFLLEMVRENLPQAVAVYSLLTIVGCVVLALPGVTFAVFAGLLFGPWLGTLICLLATTLGAILAFVAGRFFLRDTIRPLVMKNMWMKRVLFDDAGRSDIVVLMITRLVPLFPYNLQNFAYGITDIRLSTYSLCTFVFMLPGVALFTIGSAGFTAGSNGWICFAAAGVLLVMVFLLGAFVKNKYLETPSSGKDTGTRTMELTGKCIHCGLCTRTCSFLEKYKMDLAGFAERQDLAYHCFLCRDCSAVCPRQIDGRAIALALREERVSADGGKLREPGYGMLVAEKKDYLFKNYKRGQKKSVLYPGCNFPSFFPRTTDRLIDLLRERADMGVVFDCCGKPVSELGLAQAAEEGLAAMKARLRAAGVEELVTLCPNCYYFLKPRLTELSVVNIYDKLKQLGLAEQINAAAARVFVPCPDKATRELEQALAPLLRGEWEEIRDVQCCGLGGCAARKEPELARGFQAKAAEQSGEKVLAYCASCAGCLRRSGMENVRHVLTELLGTGELPVTGGSTVWNRAKRRL